MKNKIYILFFLGLILSLLFLTSCKVQPVYNETAEAEQVKAVVNTYYNAIKDKDAFKLSNVISISLDPNIVIEKYNLITRPILNSEIKTGDVTLIKNETSNELVGASVNAEFNVVFDDTDIKKSIGENPYKKRIEAVYLIRLKDKWIIYDTKTISVEDNYLKVSATLKQEIIKLTKQVISGAGQKVTQKFVLTDGLSTFNMRHTGLSNFIVELMDSSGNMIDLLANEIGPFEGSKAVRIDNVGDYILNVNADGEWQIGINEDLKSPNQEKSENSEYLATLYDLAKSFNNKKDNFYRYLLTKKYIQETADYIFTFYTSDAIVINNIMTDLTQNNFYSPNYYNYYMQDKAYISFKNTPKGELANHGDFSYYKLSNAIMDVNGKKFTSSEVLPNSIFGQDKTFVFNLGEEEIYGKDIKITIFGEDNNNLTLNVKVDKLK